MEIYEALQIYGELYHIKVEEYDFVFRCITREEYKEVSNRCSDFYDIEDQVANLCTIFPKDIDYQDLVAGMASSVAARILEVSGIQGPYTFEDLVNISRAELTDIDRQIDAVIMMSFPQYKFEDLQKLTRKQHLDLYAMAEWALNLKGFPIDLFNKEPQNQGVLPPPPPITPEMERKLRRPARYGRG
jgi:hypothetical protein